MISLKIDGIPVEVEEGATILDAAKKAGVTIPTLCHDDRLKPFGACRMCLVEVKGMPKLQPACTSPAPKDSEIITRNDRLLKIRRTILELQCVNHPLDCPVCDAAGECKLQDLVYEHALHGNRFRMERRAEAPDTRAPLVERNPNRCVSCYRCVRICHEVQGVGAIGMIHRGFKTDIGPPFEEPLDCEFCGQCISACPVGALTSRIFKYRARSWFLTKTPSTCPHCGTGCSINVEHMNGKVLRITANVGEGVNDGNLCPKGRFGYEFVNSNDRLASPLLRKNGGPSESSWDEALDGLVKGIKRVIDAGGANAVGVLGSPRLTNEENYLVQKFARVGIGTNNVDSIARFGHVHAVRNAKAAFGVLPPAPTFDAIAEAKTLVVVDSVLTETNPIVGNRLLAAIRNRGAKVVLLSPRGSKLSRHADLHLRHHPGAAGAVLMGVANALVKKGGFDKDVVEREGFAEFKKSLKDFTPASVAKACGADRKDIEDLAKRLASEGPSLFLLSLPSFENVKGSATWAATYNLSLLAGASTVGRLGVLTATEACNLQGALEMGVAPEYLPGFLMWEDKDAREAVGQAWGKPLPSNPGLSAWEMIEEVETGKLKALIVFGENPLFNFPDVLRVEKALKKLAYLVVVDPFLTETAALANVVLPASTFAEKEGTFTNAEMRIQRVNAAVPPVGGARPDWRILAELGKRFDMPGEYENVGEIASEIASVYPGFRGIEDPERTGAEGFLWREGAAKNAAPAFLAEPAVEKPKAPKKDGLTLVTGALLNHSGTVTRHCPGLNQVRGEAELRIHPEDAKARDLDDGDEALLQAGGAAANAKVRLDPTMIRGALFLPVHFEGVRTQVLVTPPDKRGEREPTSVTLEKVKAKVGAGA